MKKIDLSLILLLAFPTIASAGHTSEFNDFDGFDTSGWDSGSISNNFFRDTSYLGDFGNETVSKLIIDGGNTNDTVKLSFDFVRVSFQWGSGNSLKVSVNGTTLLDTVVLFDPDPTSQHFDLSINSNLLSWNEYGDITINFIKSGAASDTWGLDNVNIDWGTPVPLPPAFGLMALGLAGFSFFKKNIRFGMSHQLKKYNKSPT